MLIRYNISRTKWYLHPSCRDCNVDQIHYLKNQVVSTSILSRFQCLLCRERIRKIKYELFIHGIPFLAAITTFLYWDWFTAFPEYLYKWWILTWIHGAVFVCSFVMRLFQQFWPNLIQDCYIGSAWPQLMYRGVFILSSCLGVGEGVM